MNIGRDLSVSKILAMELFVVLLFSVTITFSLVHAHNDDFIKSPSADAAQNAFLSRSKRSLDGCMNGQQAREIHENARARREALLKSIRQERPLQANQEQFNRDVAAGMDRDAASILATNHHSSQTGLTSSSNPFSSNATCILAPEVEVGPFWVKGELIRKDLRETQTGVDLYLDIQMIDVKTCRPAANVYVDIWSCNATGVYAGVIDNNGGFGMSGSGNGGTSNNANLNATFSRGLQPTDTNGALQFITKFPGHYSGRTNHIHVIAHINGTVLPNNTYSGDKISHVGQMFFDQDLISSVESTSPYSSNTVQQTTNAVDRVVSNSASADTFIQYVLLGNTVADGLLGWITLGIDLTHDVTSTASFASLLTAQGGVASGNTNTGGGEGGGCPPGGVMGGPGGMGNMTGGMDGGPPGGMGGNMTGMAGCPTVNSTTVAPALGTSTTQNSAGSGGVVGTGNTGATATPYNYG